MQQLDLAVQAKIGSALAHAAEALGDNAHPLDVQAFRSLMADPDVASWMDGLRALAMLPVARDRTPGARP